MIGRRIILPLKVSCSWYRLRVSLAHSLASTEYRHIGTGQAGVTEIAQYGIFSIAKMHMYFGVGIEPICIHYY